MTSSPVMMLMSWSMVKILTPMTFSTIASMTGRALRPDGTETALANPARFRPDAIWPSAVRLAHEVGLVGAINRRLHLLKIHVPYHESDHVLNLAFIAKVRSQFLVD